MPDQQKHPFNEWWESRIHLPQDEGIARNAWNAAVHAAVDIADKSFEYSDEVDIEQIESLKVSPIGKHERLPHWTLGCVSCDNHAEIPFQSDLHGCLTGDITGLEGWQFSQGNWQCPKCLRKPRL